MPVLLAFITAIVSFLRSLSYINLRHSLPNSIESNSEDSDQNGMELTDSPGKKWHYYNIPSTEMMPASLPPSLWCGLNMKCLHNHMWLSLGTQCVVLFWKREEAETDWRKEAPRIRFLGLAYSCLLPVSSLLPASEQWGRPFATHYLPPAREKLPKPRGSHSQVFSSQWHKIVNNTIEV